MQEKAHIHIQEKDRKVSPKYNTKVAMLKPLNNEFYD